MLAVHVARNQTQILRHLKPGDRIFHLKTSHTSRRNTTLPRNIRNKIGGPRRQTCTGEKKDGTAEVTAKIQCRGGASL
jgi:hypothetical protein